MPTMQTNDIETYYDRRGDGPPIVFIHGAIVDHAQWTPQLEALSEAYTTVAYDVRGHGRTGGSEREAYSTELFAADLDALITGLDLEAPVLCGLSMGGLIAQVYAAEHPDRVRGLVLSDTFTPDLSTWGERFQLLLLRAAIPPVRLIGYERVERIMVWLQERIHGEGVSGDYEKIEELRAGAPKMETAEFAKVIRAVLAFRETEVEYSRITVPTLVLYGENEPAFIRGQSALLGANVSGATVREVPDAGHVSNLDNPPFYTDAVRALLAEAVPTEEA